MYTLHRWSLGGLLAAAASSLACSTVIEGGQCGTDDDCSGEQVCLYDLTRNTSYCTTAGCAGDDDCPDFQTCRTAVDGDMVASTQTRFCVDRIRSCTNEDGEPSEEVCNGLDEDCDGVVDDDCRPITACLDDAPCGAFVCRAPENQPATICGPPNASATVQDFEPCQRNEDCINGLCESSICAPTCRSSSVDTCRPVVGADGDTIDTFCAQSVGPGDRPPHNLCQKVCAISSGPCTDQEICAWRAVYQPVGRSHMFVCTRPDPGRKPLGAPCSGNDLEGDDECQHGLCFGGVCTRICRRGADDCPRDLGPAFDCETRNLIYGVDVFPADICVSST